MIRVTVLGSLALTLVLTLVFMVEPLRKQGLEPLEAGMVFLYILPFPFAMSLPFGALLAASITYGRFAQDREMLACRASGISTPRLLLPAVGLGLIVTIITLVLGNFISPAMMKKAEDVGMQNLTKFVFNRIRTKGDLRVKNKFSLFAGGTDEENNALLRVKLGRHRTYTDPVTGKEKRGFEAIYASRAYIDTRRDEKTGNHLISLELRDPVGPISTRLGTKVLQNEFSYDNYEFALPTQDRPMLYTWARLTKTLEDPTLHTKIRGKIENFRREVAQARFIQRILHALQSGRPFTELKTDDETFTVWAPRVRADENTIYLLGKTLQPGVTDPVSVTIHREGVAKRYRADQGKIVVRYSEMSQQVLVTIKLEGNVDVPTYNETASVKKPEWSRGGMTLPADAELDSATLADLFRYPQKYTQNKEVLARLQEDKDDTVVHILRKVVAEMHWRMAYGVSTILLVSLGAALGLIFRGGQLLTAFVISAIPAGAVILCFLMGRKLISNPDSSSTMGILLIWGALVALLIVCLAYYRRLAKE